MVDSDSDSDTNRIDTGIDSSGIVDHADDDDDGELLMRFRLKSYSSVGS